MARVAESAGVEVVRLPGLSRELSPVRDLVAALRLARDHPPGPPGRRPHAHGEGRSRRRAAALSPGGPARSSSTPTTATSCAGTSARVGSRVFRAIETILARVSDRLVAVSPQVRDELVALRRRPRVEVRGDPPRASTSSRGCTSTATPTEVRRRLGIRPDAFVVGWFGRMTAVKRTDDLIDDARRAPRARGRRAAAPRRRRRRSRAARAAGARSRARRDRASSSATRRTSRPGTRSATRWS